MKFTVIVLTPTPTPEKVAFVYPDAGNGALHWRFVTLDREDSEHLMGVDEKRGGYRCFLKSKILDGVIIDLK